MFIFLLFIYKEKSAEQDFSQQHHHHHYHTYSGESKFQSVNLYFILWIGSTLVFISVIVILFIKCQQRNKKTF
jgi:hypothetical protein